MKIINKEDGGCEFIFSQDEIKIITEKTKLHLPPEAFKHVINSMAKTFMQMMKYMKDEEKAQSTNIKEEVKTY
jgi:hypothetical protein